MLIVAPNLTIKEGYLNHWILPIAENAFALKRGILTDKAMTVVHWQQLWTPAIFLTLNQRNSSL